MLLRTLADNLVTKDRWTDSDILDIRHFSKVTIYIIETSGNYAIKYNVLVSLDGTNWKTLTTSDQVITTSDSDAYETASDAWAYIKIRYASNVAGSPGKILIKVGAK